MRSWAVSAVAVAAMVTAGCGESGGKGLSRDAQVYVAVIRDVLREQPPPAEPDLLPVVYVVGVGEESIPASVQAGVASELHEDADVRFADERTEAVLKDEPDVPVRDEGLLIAVGALAPEGDPVDLDVELYRSEVDWSNVVLTIDGGGEQWTVTSTSVVPAGEA